MNELKLVEDFRKVLADYEPSGRALKILEAVELVLLVAPTAGGRNSIIEKLVATGRYHFLVSDTTRMPRINNGKREVSGREYWFRSEKEMLDELKRGEYLEGEIIHSQQVSGMSIRELIRARDAGKIAINEVDIGGILHILKLKPDMVPILVLPPSFEEWQRRLNSRGAMPADERRRRLETAARIFEAALQNDEFNLVINDELAAAVDDVDAIAKLGELGFGKQQAARQIAEQLYRDTIAELAVRSE